MWIVCGLCLCWARHQHVNFVNHVKGCRLTFILVVQVITTQNNQVVYYMIVDRIEICKKLILKNFFFLVDKGYEPTYKLHSSEGFIEYFEFEYINNKKERKVSIVYSKSKVYEEMKYTFSATITRIPYIDATKDFFSLRLYLDSLGLDFITSIVNHFDEAEADSILQKIEQAMKLYAGEIIDGSEWKEGYYPEW